MTNNYQQFDNQAFREFYAELHIYHQFTSVGHPQTNGEAEVMNRMIIQGLKTMLDEAKDMWMEELNILWVYHPTH